MRVVPVQFLRRFRTRLRMQISYPEISSLYDADTASKHLENIIEVMPFTQLSSQTPLAIPSVIQRCLEPRYGYWLRNVWIWLEHGIVRTSDGKLIAETLPSKYRILRLLKSDAYSSYPNPEESEEVELPFASLGSGRWFGNYYHWLIDEMPRTVGLDVASEVEQLYVPSAYPDALFDLIRSITLPSIDVLRTPKKSQWIFAKRYLFLPHLTADFCGYLPRAYVKKIRKSMSQFETAERCDRRIYISRAGARMRRILNEDILIRLLEGYGFKTVKSENLSFHQQVSLFSGANLIAGSHGAGLTNMLFSPKCTVIEMFPGAAFTHYRWLSESLGHTYSNIAGRSDLGKHDDFEVDIKKVIHLLEQIL